MAEMKNMSSGAALSIMLTLIITLYLTAKHTEKTLCEKSGYVCEQIYVPTEVLK